MRAGGGKAGFLRRVRTSWQEDLTESGRAVVVCGVVAMALGAISTLVDTFLLVGFLGTFYFLSLVATWMARPRLVLEHTLPRRCVAGEPAGFAVSVVNSGARPARDVVIQPSALPEGVALSPGRRWLGTVLTRRSELRFQVRFAARGSYVLPGWRADTEFPSGLFRLGRGAQGGRSVLVYPSFTPLSVFSIPTGRRYQPGGVALASQVGDSVEYIGNREYVAGDDLRKVDWRSWARLGRPVVREHQEEYFCRIALVLDTRLAGGKRSRAVEAFEAALSLAAAVADHLSRQEYLIDIFAAGPEVYILEAGRALAHLDQILDVLACLDPCPTDPIPLIAPAVLDRVASLTSVVLLLLDLDEERLEFLERLEAEGVGLKVVLCRFWPPDVRPDAGGRVDFRVVTPEEVAAGVELL